VDESSDGADGRPTIKTRDRLLKRLIAVCLASLGGATCSDPSHIKGISGKEKR